MLCGDCEHCEMVKRYNRKYRKEVIEYMCKLDYRYKRKKVEKCRDYLPKTQSRIDWFMGKKMLDI